MNGWMEKLEFRVPEWDLGTQSDLRPFLFCQLLPDSLALLLFGTSSLQHDLVYVSLPL